MRLKEFEVRAIKEAVRSFDEDATIYLFGSRTDDSKRGGDIDLIVSSDKITSGDIVKIKQIIFEGIDEQKIDILITDKKIKPKNPKDSIFLELIRNEREEL